MQQNLTPDSAPIVVDRVEWVPASPEAVEVRVYGRWRHRPPEAPLVLLVADAGREARFDPVPAGLAGAILAYAVPSELRGRLVLDGALALGVGPARLALPAAAVGSLHGEVPGDTSTTVVDRSVLAERRARRAELAEEALARRAEDAERAAVTLEAQLANVEERLADAAAERDELEARVAERERMLRAAAQREYAEQQRRIEAEDELAEEQRAAEAELADLRARLAEARQRVEQSARELSRARRAAAEAQQAAERELAERERAQEEMERERAEREEAQREAERERAEREEAQREAERERAEREEAQREAERERAERKEAQREAERERAEREEAQQAAERERAELERSAAQVRDGSAAPVSAELREQVAAVRRATDDLARDLAAERDARAAAHARLAEEVGGAHAGLSRIGQQLDRRLTFDEAIHRELAGLRGELERLQAHGGAAGGRPPDGAAMREQLDDLEDRRRAAEAALAAAREVLRERSDELERARAEADRARADLLRERETMHREVAATEAELRTQLASQRQAFADQVAAVEQTVGTLRDGLAGAATELRERVAAERAAREAAEAELAARRDADARALAELEAVRRDVAARREAEARAQAQIEAVQSELAARRDAEARALAEVEAVRAELTQVRAELDRLRAESERARAEEEARAARPAESGRLIDNLGSAADRLRAQLPPAEEPPPGEPLMPRVIDAGQRRERPWLAPALAAFAERDPVAAGRLLVALLPVQRHRIQEPVTYGLTVRELGTFRVQARPGSVLVEACRERGELRDVTFHLEGPAAALASLAAGNAPRRRLRGADLDGRRRTLRALLKQLRDPLGLTDVLEAGMSLEPGLVLGALAAGIDPAWTDGHRFAVGWAVTGRRACTHVVTVAGGSPVTVAPAHEGRVPDATVHVPQPAFLPLLAGRALPPETTPTVEGDADAVALLRSWMDRVQGLSGP